MGNLKDYIRILESGSRDKGGAVDFGVPSLGAEHLDNTGKLILNKNLKYISFEHYKKMTSGKIEKEDVLVVKDGATTGKTCFVSTNFPYRQAAINEHVFLLRPKDTLLPKYLFYFLYSDYGKHLVLKDFRGATVGGISRNFIDIPIELPTLDVQQKIIDVLDKASEFIELRKAQLDKLNLLVKSQFIEMFGNPVKNSMGWPKYSLGEKCEIITGNTPPRADENNYGNYIEWIKSDNIETESSVLTHAKEFLSGKGFSLCRYVEAGSILMTCIAGSLKSIGNVAITNRRVAFNQQINAIIPNENNVQFMYWMFKLSQPLIHESVNMMLKGILSKGKLSEIPFIFPPFDHQEEFAAFVEQADKSKFTLQQSLEKLELNYKSLMQKCFRGDLF